jgi:signal transduction histidine kinase
MKNKIKDILMLINYICFSGIFLVNSIFNASNQFTVVTLYFLFLTSYTLRVFIVYSSEEYNNFKYFSLSIDIILIFIINRYDSSFFSYTLYIFMIEDIIINFDSYYAAFTACILYVIYSFSLYTAFNAVSASALPKILISLPVFAVIYIIFFLIKYLLKQTETIEASLMETTIKKLEKDIIYNNLKEAYEKVEMITAYKERNKIAREIHDTVGHTLTTVLVELEAAKRLMSKDLALAQEKLSLAQGQVRKGLNDIRGSVRVLEKGDEIKDFYPAVEALIKDTEQHSGVIIKAQLDTSIQIPKAAQKVIFSALLEGLANGIRHGRSTAFLLKLYSSAGRVFFSLEDNGQGTSTFSLGFGLRAMRDRVFELGGTFEAQSKPSEGFSLYLSFPV